MEGRLLFYTFTPAHDDENPKVKHRQIYQQNKNKGRITTILVHPYLLKCKSSTMTVT